MFFSDKTFRTSIIIHPNCYLGRSIPGKTIEKSFGLITQLTKGLGSNVNDKTEEIIDNFLIKLLNLELIPL